MPRFARYIGIDYSGAETAGSSLKGLRVYAASDSASPREVPPPPSPRRYWSRRGTAEWLVEVLGSGPPCIVGIDHGFSFPLRYFDKHSLAPDWGAFLDDFCQHWPTHEEHTYVDFIRDGVVGQGALRSGDRRWRRLTELRAGSAKSVFHFDVQGQVAKSTHAGIPWLRFLRERLGNRVHFWPFDGWLPTAGVSVVAEAYPAIYRDEVALPPVTPDQQDAFAITAWMQNADRSGALERHFQPTLTPSERTLAQVEGWILGVPGQEATAGRGAGRALALSKKRARDFLARQIRLELVENPPSIYGVDCSTMDIYRVVEDGRDGASRYIGVSKATGQVRDLGYLGG